MRPWRAISLLNIANHTVLSAFGIPNRNSGIASNKYRFDRLIVRETMCNILRNIGSYLFETVKINGNK